MKNKITLLLLLFLLVPVACGAMPLTLEQCIRQGLTNNPEIQAYQFAVEEADEAINVSWGAFLPTLSVDYRKGQLQNDTKGERDTDYLDQDSETLSVRLNQTLFAGFSGVASLKKARQSKQYHQYELEYIRLEVAQKIRTSYLDILQQQQLQAKWQESIKRLQRQLKIATAWVEQKLAPKLRVLEVEVELANARQQLVTTQANLKIAKATLRQLLSIGPDEKITIQPLAEESCLPQTFQALRQCVDLAKHQRPELQMVKLAVEMAQQDAKIILARNMPRADFDVAWVDYNRDYSNSRYIDTDRKYYSANLTLSMKFFQGGRNLFAWRQQRVTIKRLQQRQRSQNNEIVQQVQSRYHQYIEAKAQIETAAKGLKEAQEAYRMSDKSARLGVLSLGDLLDTELRLTRAEINVINSRFSLLKAKVLLDRAIGTPVI